MRTMYDDCSSGGTCPPADSPGGAPSFASPPCGAGAVGGVSLATAPSEESPSGGSWRATATDHAHNTATTSAVSRKPGRPGRAGTIMRYLFQACVVMGAKVYHAVRGSVPPSRRGSAGPVSRFRPRVLCFGRGEVGVSCGGTLG